MGTENQLDKEALKLMKKTIKANKGGVVTALRQSFVKVPNNISDDNLYFLITDELVNKRNGFLVYHLGTVMDEQDTSNFEAKSNFDIGSLFPIGSKLGLFGGGKDKQPTAPAGPDPMMLQMQMAQQQAQQQAQRERAEAQARRDEADRKRKTNMMIFGIVGGVVVIGGITTAILMSRKK
jgi:hypothetical protein